MEHQASTQRLFFARDPLGRRSLLIHKPNSHSPYFLLTSVSVGSHPSYELEELSTDVICCLDIRQLCETSDVNHYCRLPLMLSNRSLDSE
jgi:asparagine synthetase B (glutamine-hydrolysing)